MTTLVEANLEVYIRIDSLIPSVKAMCTIIHAKNQGVNLYSYGTYRKFSSKMTTIKSNSALIIQKQCPKYRFTWIKQFPEN